MTWRRGAPWVGRVESPSQEAELGRWAEGGEAETMGEAVGSSPRPAEGRERGRGRENKKIESGREGKE